MTRSSLTRRSFLGRSAAGGPALAQDKCFRFITRFGYSLSGAAIGVATPHSLAGLALDHRGQVRGALAGLTSWPRISSGRLRSGVPVRWLTVR